MADEKRSVDEWPTPPGADQIPPPEPVPARPPPWEEAPQGAPGVPIRTGEGWTAGGQVKLVLCPMCRHLQGDGSCSGSPPESYRSDPRTTHCPAFRRL